MISACRKIGWTIQVVVMGEALLLALVSLYALQSDARVFRYAGF